MCEYRMNNVDFIKGYFGHPVFASHMWHYVCLTLAMNHIVTFDFMVLILIKKTGRKRETQIGRDSIEGSMLSLSEVKRRVLNGPYH